MRVSKKIRAEAITICAIAASAEWPPGCVEEIVRDGDFDFDAGDLADEAGNHVDVWCGIRELWAEAECMLREGWCPPPDAEEMRG